MITTPYKSKLIICKNILRGGEGLAGKNQLSAISSCIKTRGLKMKTFVSNERLTFWLYVCSKKQPTPTFYGRYCDDSFCPQDRAKCIILGHIEPLNTTNKGYNQGNVSRWYAACLYAHISTNNNQIEIKHQHFKVMNLNLFVQSHQACIIMFFLSVQMRLHRFCLIQIRHGLVINLSLILNGKRNNEIFRHLIRATISFARFLLLKIDNPCS